MARIINRGDNLKILKGKEYNYCGIRKLNHNDMVHIGILAIIVAVGLLLLSMPVSAADVGVDVSVDSTTKNGTVGADIMYVITVTNNGNMDDTFNLSVDNVDGVQTATLDNVSLAVLANQSDTTVLHVADNVSGNYTVNVTATSINDSGINDTVSTITTIEEILPPVSGDVDVSVDSSTKNGTVGADIMYVITVTNNGNMDDTFNLSVDNVDGVQTATLDNVSLAVLANQSDTTVLHVADNVSGNYTVNVTATSINDSGINDTVSTITTIEEIPVLIEIAMRDIENQFLLPGGSTNVTVNITSNMAQALSLQENIAEGWILTPISDDSSVFKNSTNEWVWFSVDEGVTKTVMYNITIPEDAPMGTYFINGSVSNSSGMIGIVSRENSIILEDILMYYRGLGESPDNVETSDMLQASEDWVKGVIVPGFNVPITLKHLLMLANEWILG